MDGEGRRRIYEHTFHVEISAPGDHEIRVVLAGNDRAPLAIEGEPIEAAATVTVPGCLLRADPGRRPIQNGSSRS